MNPLNVPIDLYGIWHVSIFVGLVVCATHAFWSYKKRIGAIATILWIYVIVRALLIVEFPGLPFGDYTRAFQATAGQTLAEVFLIPVMALTAPVLLSQALPCLVLAEVLLIFVNGFGLFLAPSFDTAFLALTLPLIHPYIALLSIATIITHHGSTALLIMVAQAFGYALKFKEMRKWFFVVTPLLVLVAYFHQHSVWFDGLERLQAYRRFMQFWLSDPFYVVLGVGPGSFKWCSLLIDNFKPPMFLMMHSDWLQMTFELGLVGLVLILGVFWKGLRNSWAHPNLFASVMGAAAFGLTYHPLRFFPSAIVIALIFRLALVIE